MTDELTPEERDALKSLPRERMPSAGLEDRVVAAMRERGTLSPPARRGRVVRITPPRVAGLLAACVALMIGAYSIGLQRGGFRPEVREALEPRTFERIPANEEGILSGETAPRDEPATQSLPSAPAEERKQSFEAPATKQEAPAEKLDWSLKDTGRARNDAATESVARDEASSLEAAPAPTPSSSAPVPSPERQSSRELDATMAKKSLQSSPQIPSATDMRPWKMKANDQPSRTRVEREYRLGSYLFMIDAPDSVRIVEDESGRTLLLYTSDGVIRIRMPE